MPVENPKILSRNFHSPESWTLAAYERAGGYLQLRKALTMEPAKIAEEVKAANIRGRGGAGFPAGVKWGFLKPSPKPTYLAVNADEGEPGTFKDRMLMERDPHRCIEGFIISAYAIGAHTVFCYIRGELVLAIRRMEQAVRDARAAGYLGEAILDKPFKLDIVIHAGAGAYICGEETAMLNSLEGLRGEPRLKPPFPAIVGAFGGPTIVNNLETMATIPSVVELGGEGFSKLSRIHHLRDGGVRLYGVSGHVKKPGVYEAPVGITLRELIWDLGGGVRGDKKMKCVIPGGSSTPVLREDDVVIAPDEKHVLHAWHGKSHIDVPMGVDTMRALGTMLGTCCATVIDEDTSMVRVAENLMTFYAHETCGQCTPCREGCPWMARLCTKFAEGKATKVDLDTLCDVANNITGNTICALGDGAAMPMMGILKLFRGEFEAAVESGVAASKVR